MTSQSVLLIVAGCAGWFWFSLSPGSWLGFSLSSGDWGWLLRERDSEKNTQRSELRLAGRRSLVSHCTLLAVGLAAGVNSGNCAVSEALAVMTVVSGGLFAGFLLLLWSTRPGGWYGHR